MKMVKRILKDLPDILGQQLSPKEYAKKIKQLDKDMQIAITKRKKRKKRNRSSRKKFFA